MGAAHFEGRCFTLGTGIRPELGSELTQHRRPHGERKPRVRSARWPSSQEISSRELLGARSSGWRAEGHLPQSRPDLMPRRADPELERRRTWSTPVFLEREPSCWRKRRFSAGGTKMRQPARPPARPPRRAGVARGRCRRVLGYSGGADLLQNGGVRQEPSWWLTRYVQRKAGWEGTDV